MNKSSIVQLYFLIGNIIYFKLKDNIKKSLYIFKVLLSVYNSLHFRINAVPEVLICAILKLSRVNAYHNNILIISGPFKQVTWCLVHFNNGTYSRKLQIMYSPMLPPKCILCSQSLLFNLKQALSVVPFENVTFCFKVHELFEYEPCQLLSLQISPVSSSHEIDSKIYDLMISNFMSQNHYVCVDDVIPLSGEFYSSKLTNLTFYVKVKGITPEVECRLVKDELFVTSSKTTVFQLKDVIGFIPSRKYEFLDPSSLNTLVPIGPFCFQESIMKISRWFTPFLSKKLKDLDPYFIIFGSDPGSNTLILRYSAELLGVKFIQVDCNNLISNTSAQVQANFKNCFNKILDIVPVLVEFINIELLWKDTEGYDSEMLISSFLESLNEISKKSEKQALLVANCSNSSDMPSNLKSASLACYEVPSLEASQRKLALIWLSKSLRTPAFSPGLLNIIVHETSSYTFSDLRKLLILGFKDWTKKGKSGYLTLDHLKPNIEKMCKIGRVIDSGSVSWADVGGVEDIKNAITQSVVSNQVSGNLRRTGILLYGPPGTGKTLLARAVAAQSNSAFIPVKGPELLNMYVGQSEANIRQVFSKAKEAAPCILFFDELDSLAPNRGTKSDSASVMDRVVSQLLAEMDSLEQDDKVFILAATNRPDLLDSALLRPGRLDKTLYVGPCSDCVSKMKVFNAVTRKFIFDEKFNAGIVIEKLPEEVTGAQVYSICYQAWMNAASELIGSGQYKESSVVVRQEHFTLV